MSPHDGRDRGPEHDRRVSWGTDRDPAVYARRRRRAARRRATVDRRDADPVPPGDDDWVVPDRSQLTRLPSGPEPLSAVLEQVVSDRAWGQRLRGVAVFDRWAEVVGDDVARHCRPVRLSGGVLTVAADSATWATQLRYLGAKLALNVNSALDEPLVTSINIVVAPPPRP